MAIEAYQIIVLVTLFIIYGIFLIFDIFGRNENYGYLAYIVAVIPVNYIWSFGPEYILVTYIVLFILWDITLLRDTFGLYMKKNKEINDILLYLVLAIIVQLIVTAILPETDEALKDNTEQLLYFWLPNIHSAVFEGSQTPVLAFKLSASLMVLLIIIPLILDIKDEEIPLPMFVIIIAIFIIPFLYISYIWLPGPETLGVLTFLFSVILFIILLLITRSGKEVK
ncbi:MAG: hypothetical protein ACFE9T_06250 [Promethearchaeota archaeon]